MYVCTYVALDDSTQGLITYCSCRIHVTVSPLHLTNGAFPLVEELLALLVGMAELFCSLVQLNLHRRAVSTVEQSQPCCEQIYL